MVRPPPPGPAAHSTESLGGCVGEVPSDLGSVPFRRPSVGSPPTGASGGSSPSWASSTLPR
eukprot:7690935-Lingulodinium_polyedra.AAC.1